MIFKSIDQYEKGKFGGKIPAENNENLLPCENFRSGGILIINGNWLVLISVENERLKMKVSWK